MINGPITNWSQDVWYYCWENVHYLTDLPWVWPVAALPGRNLQQSNISPQLNYTYSQTSTSCSTFCCGADTLPHHSVCTVSIKILEFSPEVFSMLHFWCLWKWEETQALESILLESLLWAIFSSKDELQSDWRAMKSKDSSKELIRFSHWVVDQDG